MNTLMISEPEYASILLDMELCASVDALRRVLAFRDVESTSRLTNMYPFLRRVEETIDVQTFIAFITKLWAKSDTPCESRLSRMVS